MGCGISTSNLPNYMRGGHNPATRKPGQLGWHDDDYDDHKVAIIDRRNNVYSNAVDLHNDDRPSRDQRIRTVSSPRAKTQPFFNMGNGLRINVSSPRAMTQPNFEMGNGQRISVSSPHAMTQPNFDMGNGQRISVSSPHMGNGREHGTRNDNEKTAERNKEINNREDREEDSDDESEHDGSHIGNSSWIGSPSFRDYCDNPWDSVDSHDIGKSDGESKETKTQGGLDHASPKPNKGLDSSSRRRRGSRFRKVFPPGRSSAMKNIINAATCYNPNHATSRVGHGN